MEHFQRLWGALQQALDYVSSFTTYLLGDETHPGAEASGATRERRNYSGHHSGEVESTCYGNISSRGHLGVLEDPCTAEINPAREQMQVASEPADDSAPPARDVLKSSKLPDKCEGWEEHEQKLSESSQFPADASKTKPTATGICGTLQDHLEEPRMIEGLHQREPEGLSWKGRTQHEGVEDTGCDLPWEPGRQGDRELAGIIGSQGEQKKKEEIVRKEDIQEQAEEGVWFAEEQQRELERVKYNEGFQPVGLEKEVKMVNHHKVKAEREQQDEIGNQQGQQDMAGAEGVLQGKPESQEDQEKMLEGAGKSHQWDLKWDVEGAEGTQESQENGQEMISTNEGLPQAVSAFSLLSGGMQRRLEEATKMAGGQQLKVGEEKEEEQEEEEQGQEHKKEYEQQHEQEREHEQECEHEHKHKHKQEREQEHEPKQEREHECEQEREHEQEQESEPEQEHEREHEQEHEQEREHEHEQECEHECEQECEHEQESECEQECEPEREHKQEQEHEQEQECEPKQGREHECEREHEQEREREHKQEREQEHEHIQEHEHEHEQEQESEPEHQQECEPEQECEPKQEREHERECEREQEREREHKQEREQEQEHEHIQEHEHEHEHEQEQENEPELEQESEPEQEPEQECEREQEREHEHEHKQVHEHEQEHEQEQESKPEHEQEHEHEQEDHQQAVLDVVAAAAAEGIQPAMPDKGKTEREQEEALKGAKNSYLWESLETVTLEEQSEDSKGVVEIRKGLQDDLEGNQEELEEVVGNGEEQEEQTGELDSDQNGELERLAEHNELDEEELVEAKATEVQLTEPEKIERNLQEPMVCSASFNTELSAGLRAFPDEVTPLDTSAQKERVLLRRKSSIRRAPSVKKPRSPVKTQPQETNMDEEIPPEPQIPTKPKLRHSGFGPMHPNMMAELQMRLRKPQ